MNEKRREVLGQFDATPAGGRFDRGPWAAMAAAVMLVLLPFARWEGFDYAHYAGGVLFQISVLGLLLIWGYRGRAPGREGWRRGAVVLLAGYAALSAVSWLWAPARRLAAIGSIPVLFSVAWALCLGVMLRRREDLRLVLRAVFVSGTLASVIALCWVYSWGGKSGDVEQVFGHRNYLAIFLLPPMLLGAAEVMGYFASRRSPRGGPLRLHAVVVVPCMSLMLFVMAVCVSAGAMLGLAAGAGCLVVSRVSRRKRRWIVYAVCVVALAGILVASLPATGEWLLSRAGGSHFWKSQATRLFMWRGTVRMIAERPLSGWGTGMFMPRFAEFKPTEPMRYGALTSITLYPHNELLLVVVEGGLLALVLYACGIFAAAGSCVRAAEKARDEGERLIGWAVFAGFTAMFVQGLVSVALRFWAPSALYWTLVGVMLAHRHCAEGTENVEVQAGPWHLLDFLKFAVAAVVVAGAAWWVVYSGARAEWLMGSHCSGGSVPGRVCAERLSEAVQHSRYVPDYLRGLHRRALQLRAIGELDAAIAACEEMDGIAPGLGPTRRMLGDLCLEKAALDRSDNADRRTGLLKRARAALDRALDQNPYDPFTHLVYAEVALAAPSRDLRQAIGHVTEALQTPPTVEAEKKIFQSRAAFVLWKIRGLCGPEDVDVIKRLDALNSRLHAEAEGGQDGG